MVTWDQGDTLQARPQHRHGPHLTEWRLATRSEAEIAEVDVILVNYGARHPVGRVSMEFGGGREPELRTTVWRPGREPRHRRLGTADDHGPPVQL